MWSLSKMHQAGELIAAIAVVISLIFVGLQIKDNTIATEAATYQDTVAYDIEILLNMGSTPEMARVFFTFRDDLLRHLLFSGYFDPLFWYNLGIES